MLKTWCSRTEAPSLFLYQLIETWMWAGIDGPWLSCVLTAVCRSAGGCALALSAQARCEGPDPLREMVGWLSSTLLDPSSWAGATIPPAPKRSTAAAVCSNSPFAATHMARASGDRDANGVEGEVVHLSTHHSFRKSHTCDYTLHCLISIFYCT